MAELCAMTFRQVPEWSGPLTVSYLTRTNCRSRVKRQFAARTIRGLLGVELPSPNMTVPVTDRSLDRRGRDGSKVFPVIDPDRIGRKASRRADRRAEQCLLREFRLTSSRSREAASSQLACRRGVRDLRRSGAAGHRFTHWGEDPWGRVVGGRRRGRRFRCCGG